MSQGCFAPTLYGCMEYNERSSTEDMVVREGKEKKPKTRFGCITCKARKVKCDETQSACLRCLKLYGHCEGYPTTLPMIRRRRKQTPFKRRNVIPLLPRPEVSSMQKDSLQLRSLLDEPSFTSEEEYRYFSIFRNETVADLPGFFESDLWDHIILQASHREPFIRDAAIAIGALSCCGREFIETCNAHMRGEKKKLKASRHYRFALQQYGIAISKMRKALGKGGLRIGLVACLLVVCLEGLQGNFERALEHGVAGCRLLGDWLDRQSLLSEVGEGIGSPKEVEIEDEIVNAFQRLELQVLSYVDLKQTGLHLRLRNETIWNMPGVFETVKEARLYWEWVHRRTSHFIAAESVPVLDLEESRSIASIQREKLNLLSAEMKRWFHAFTPFFNTLERHSKAWTGAALLCIHAKTTEIMLLSSSFGDECLLDQYLPEFREIVHLAREILLDPLFRTQTAFTFDQGLVNPLRLVGRWCTDTTVRQEAVQILQETAMREALYDGLIVAKTQEWIMSIEEEGLEFGEFVPEERRAKVTGVKIDYGKRVAIIKSERLGGDNDDERETEIGWGIGNVAMSIYAYAERS